MKIFNPPHPGKVVHELCIKPLKLSITDAAKSLGVARETLSAVVNGRAAISALMAIRITRAFGGSAESWLGQQMNYDLWHAEQAAKNLKITRYSASRKTA